jgi:hypothetical protein
VCRAADREAIGGGGEHWEATRYLNNELSAPIPDEMADLVLGRGCNLEGNHTELGRVVDAFDEGSRRVSMPSQEATAVKEAAFAARDTE